jgi:Zn-finger nucleic acid-binding protein
MLCPVCREELVIVEFDDVELDACPDCHGLWFDAQELHQLFEAAGVPDHLYSLEERLERLPRAAARRRCPRCRGRIVPVRAPSDTKEIILDQCPDGHGLWFDQGELESLLECLLQEDEALDRVRDYLGQFMTTGKSNSEDQPPATAN